MNGADSFAALRGCLISYREMGPPFASRRNILSVCHWLVFPIAASYWEKQGQWHTEPKCATSKLAPRVSEWWIERDQ